MTLLDFLGMDKNLFLVNFMLYLSLIYFSYIVYK